MDMEQPEQAIIPYTKAADYYEAEYGDDDLSVIESRLSLAQAYIDAKQDEQGLAIVSKNIDILNEIVEVDLDDLDFAKQHDDDDEATDFICSEIAEAYDFLGWAYEIKNDNATSEEYYNKANADCK